MPSTNRTRRDTSSRKMSSITIIRKGSSIMAMRIRKMTIRRKPIMEMSSRERGKRYSLLGLSCTPTPYLCKNIKQTSPTKDTTVTLLISSKPLNPSISSNNFKPNPHLKPCRSATFNSENVSVLANSGMCTCVSTSKQDSSALSKRYSSRPSRTTRWKSSSQLSSRSIIA